MQKATIREIISAVKLDKLETKLLLRHVLKLTQAELIMFNDRVLSNDELIQFDKLLQQRLSGVPINYILGYREFYSRQFKVTVNTLIPRPETEILVAEILNRLTPGDALLDLGTGTGCIAITCKLEMPTIVVVAIDKDQATLEVARGNANKLGAEITFLQSDWYENINGKFAIIVSNPPYIANNDPHLENLSHEPQHALTDFNDGLDCFRHIISGANKYLLFNGYLLLEHGFDQAVQIREMLTESGFMNIKTIKDYAGLDRITIGQIISV